MTDLLILHLKYKYYEMFRNREKDTEYREFKPYWIQRIHGQKRAVLVPGYVLDNSMDISADILSIKVVGFDDLPEHARQEFKDSEYREFFAIKLKLDERMME